MKSESQPTFDDETLVAYLDGELPREVADRIEGQLKIDDSLRQRLAQLGTSWEMLDQLPTPSTNPKLAQSTIELVALSVAQSKEKAWKSQLKKHLGWTLAASVLLAYLLGVGLASLRGQRTTEELLEDLPLLCHYRELELVDSPKWLDRLATIPDLLEAGLPLNEQPACPSHPDRTTELLPWLDSLPATERQELNRKYEDFRQTTQLRKTQLRQIAKTLQDRSSAVDYRKILAAYSGLASQISSAELAQIMAIDNLERRAAEIIRIVDRELAIGYAYQLTDDEKRAVQTWANNLKENNFEYFFGLEDPDSEIVRLLDTDSPDSLISDQDLTDLTQRIAPKGRDLLARVAPELHSNILRLWVYASLPNLRSAQQLTTEELQRRFSELPLERQNEYIYLSGSEVLRRLKANDPETKPGL
jgi:hypothetical protein